MDTHTPPEFWVKTKWKRFAILEMLNAEMRPRFTIDIGQVKADAGHSVP